MIYALIKNGIVVNIIVGDPSTIDSIELDADVVLPITDGGIGDTYDEKSQTIIKNIGET